MTDDRDRVDRLAAVVLAATLLTASAACDGPPQDPRSEPPVSSPTAPIGRLATSEAKSIEPDVRRSAAEAVADFVNAARAGDCDKAWSQTDRDLVEQLGTRESFCRRTLASVPTTLGQGSLRADDGLVWVRFPDGVQLALTELDSSPTVTPLPYVPSSDLFPFDPRTAAGANREFLIRMQFVAATVADDRNADPDLSDLPWIDSRTGDIDLTGADAAMVDRWNNVLERLLPAAVNQTIATLIDPEAGRLPPSLYP